MPITSTTDHQVTLITIDRPHRRGALDLAHLEELSAAVGAAARSRAVVLHGSGGHFCAGADLHELEDVSFTDRLAEVLLELSELPIPTYAAISGSCMGLGVQLASACDLRVVADDARFAVPVARLGIMVNHWTLHRLAQVWGVGAARQLVLTGAVLDAEDAWRLGFTQARGDLETALQLARDAALLAPLSQSGSKLGFNASDSTDRTLARYDAAFAQAWSSDDVAEGRAAFRERRTPTFTGS